MKKGYGRGVSLGGVFERDPVVPASQEVDRLPRHGTTSILCCTAVVLWLTHSLVHLQRKIPQGNEIVWLLSHESLYRTGTASVQVDSMSPVHINWHPPLMWLVTQLFMLTGLDALQSTLMVNLISGFVTIVATWWLGYYLARREVLQDASQFGSLSVVVLCLIPLFQAGSGIIDIDNGLLTAIMTAYLAVLLAVCGRISKLRLILLGFIFGIALLTKISTPVILVPLTFAFFRHEQGEEKKALISTAVMLLISLVLFAVVYWITRPLFDGDWWGIFRHSSSHVALKSRSDWVNKFRTLGELSVWIGPPAGIFVLASIGRFWGPLHDRRFGNVLPALLLVYIIGIWGVFAYLGVTFNLRYMIPSLPVLAVVTVMFLVYQGAFGLRASSPWRFRELAGFALLLSLTFYLLPDPILYLRTELKYNFWRALAFYSFALLGVCLGTYFLLWWFRKRGIRIGNMAVAWLACIWLVFNLNTSVKQIVGNYQLGYDYGTSEYDGVIRWLSEHAQVGAPIIAPRDFFWLLRGRYPANPLYDDGSLESVTGAYRDGRRSSFYYQILPRRLPASGRARIESMMFGSEVIYRNEDFVIVRKNF